MSSLSQPPNTYLISRRKYMYHQKLLIDWRSSMSQTSLGTTGFDMLKFSDSKSQGIQNDCKVYMNTYVQRSFVLYWRENMTQILTYNYFWNICRCPSWGSLFSAHGCQTVPTPFVKRLSLLHLITFAHLSKNNLLYLCGSISGFCSISLIGVFIPCQYHIALIIIVYFFIS